MRDRLRAWGSFVTRPSTIRGAWAVGWPLAIWSASLINPWMTLPAGPLAAEQWMFEVLPASVIVPGLLGCLAFPLASLLRSRPEVPARLDRLAVGALFAVTTTVGLWSVLTPPSRGVEDWAQRLGAPLAGPGVINEAVPVERPPGVSAAYAINVRAPDVPYPRGEPAARIPVVGRALVFSACSGHTRYIGFEGSRETTEILYAPGAPWQPIRVFEMENGVWLVSSSLQARDRGSFGMTRVLSGQDRFWLGIAPALALLPRPLGAPIALAWLLALAPLLGGASWLASLRARRRIAAIENALDTPHYRLSAATDRETRIAETRTQIARLEALAVLVMILLATPGLVAVARGLTLSLGIG